MFKPKYKAFIVNCLFGFMLLASFFSIGAKSFAQTPDSIDRTVDNGLCYDQLRASAGVRKCSDRQDQYPSASGKFEDGKCYNLEYNQHFNALIYFEKGCDEEPFKTAIANTPGATLSGTKFILLPTDTAIDKCAGSEQTACGFLGYVNAGIKFLGAAIGIVATIMIIVGGIQYSQSGGDPQAAAAAKKRITNAIFTLVAFGLLMAVLQWVVPGGIF